jgi:LmbE family N-acetylglucosaminyl deacetylase
MGVVLAIGAHPDDVEFGCGGFLQHFSQRHILLASNGSRGGSNRISEARVASAVLGADLQILDMPDTALEVKDLIPCLEAVIARLKPTVVLTLPEDDAHQDHSAVFRATRVATRDVIGTVLSYATPSAAERFRPTWYVPLTGDQLARKLKAIRCHESQAGRVYLAPDHVEAMARYWATAIRHSAPYVEPYELVRHRAELKP